uniref:Uncharacterized protein n=1 Tax=Agarophyton chilense TaxID=2510777 RepID=A0A0D5Y8I9_AGACH|nr:hypothetical protein XM44_gp25 [Agarophyton chilense]AKA27608.1 hypothetical protein Gchil_005 [Agarophyton chilense]ASP44536.1 hypothetical protein [Agarophyton chilense]UAD89539.1 hypothetical protein [Agarophyton chilense]
MNQSRLYNQYNFIEAFDFLDNNCSQHPNFLVLKTKTCLHIFNKIENLNPSKTFRNNLLLEALTGQRFFFTYKRKSKKKVLLSTKVTVRNNNLFLFLETLLHSILLMQQYKVNLQKTKITYLDFFFHSKVLNKLSMQTLINNYFIISN